MLFPLWAMDLLVKGSLALSAVALFWLLFLLWRDWRRGELW